MGLARIEIHADGPKGQIMVNGLDVAPAVKVAHLDLTGGTVPRLTLQLGASPVHFEGDGIVHVASEADGDPREVILGFLDAIDAEGLSKRVLDLSDWGSDPGESWIKALRELVQ